MKGRCEVVRLCFESEFEWRPAEWAGVVWRGVARQGAHPCATVRPPRTGATARMSGCAVFDIFIFFTFNMTIFSLITFKCQT